ncbi:TraX family protein, partial [Pseudomonas syringae pv. tagetis]|uniref:TraX family protein n=1 Tax=Pseudomonas syringae group genomosp. 7 TaxID=251699 RepID=UPI00376F83BE
ALYLLKWLAMLSMVLDHLRYEGWSVDFLYVTGRFSFPWFCLAIAVNLSRRSADFVAPRVQCGYLGWVLVFAALSEIPYRLFMADTTVLNVMPTLLLGMLIAQGWRHSRVTARTRARVA